MRHEFAADVQSAAASPALCRALGLAALAAEFNLPVEVFEPDEAEAIESGAAALFLAGSGPRLTGAAPLAAV